MVIISVAGNANYASMVYDSAGRIDIRTLGNGLTQKYLYKPWDAPAQGGRLDMMIAGTGAWDENNHNFATTLQKSDYTYDSVGNITTIDDSMWGETQTFGYDSLNRLTSASATGGLANYNETYTYDPTTGNLDLKGDLNIDYGDTNHIHAATSATLGANTNTYEYDDNGNMDTRIIGGQTVHLDYDAENRLVSVTGTNLSAQFTYNGDGQRVKSVVNGETILFVGGHFEMKGNEVTKYYFAGASRIAVRKYVVPQSTTLTYLVGDHLGSTSLAVNASTGEVVETRYKPWGEVRWTTESKTLPTRYTFTGQYSYIADSATDLIASNSFGLMFYNARWYDPALGRMAQADTIVPGGVQGLDRYAYVNNSPINYVDPSGHESGNCYDRGYCDEDPKPLLTFENEAGAQSISLEEQSILNARAQEVADALADEINKQCPDEAYQLGICFRVTSQQAFYGTFGGPIKVRRITENCGTDANGNDNCFMEYKHDDPNDLYIAIYSNTSTADILSFSRVLVHEIGHKFYWDAGGFIDGSSVGGRNGFHGGLGSWQFATNYAEPGRNDREIFADMFVGWVYGKWEEGNTPTGLSVDGNQKKEYMDKYMPIMVGNALW